jgi:hypothetical protein
LFAAQPIHESGTVKTYNRIVRKIERQLHGNYYTDSIAAAIYNEYTFNDSSKQLLKAVHLAYFPIPTWDGDAVYYEKSHHFNRTFARSFYLTAKLYDPYPGTEYGRTVLAGRKYPVIDIKVPHSELFNWVQNNKMRRDAAQNNNRKDLSPLPSSMAYTVNKFISSPSKSTKHYEVSDTLYNGILCYKLRLSRYGQSVYGEEERRKFEQALISGYTDYTQEEKDELKYYVEYWGNGAGTSIMDYVIDKKDYALLHLYYHEMHANSAGQWFVTRHYTEDYKKGGDNKYHQVYYAKYQLNFVHGTIYYNDQHLATWVVQRPLGRPYSPDEVKKFPQRINFDYEDFCEIIPVPDEEMLEEWRQFSPIFDN